MRPILVKGWTRMEKVAEFYARWFAKKRAPDYWDAEAASEAFANDLLGVHESNKRDFSQSCYVKFLRGTIVNLNSRAHLQGEEQMTLSEVIAFLEAQPKELCPWYRRNQGRAHLVTGPYSRKARPCPWRAKESIGRAYD
jgi:hypothetical protein